jgi:hypothetical protein
LTTSSSSKKDICLSSSAVLFISEVEEQVRGGEVRKSHENSPSSTVDGNAFLIKRGLPWTRWRNPRRQTPVNVIPDGRLRQLWVFPDDNAEQIFRRLVRFVPSTQVRSALIGHLHLRVEHLQPHHVRLDDGKSQNLASSFGA